MKKVFINNYFFTCSIKYMVVAMLLLCQQGYSQEIIQINPQNTCAMFCGDVPTSLDVSAPSYSAINIIHNILSQVGLKPNFELRASSRVGEKIALAYISPDGKKYIFYDETELRKIDLHSQNNWASIFILAHEMGHHLSAHKINLMQNSRENELDADEFAGFVLYYMDASLDDALSAIRYMPEKDCGSHPDKKSRLQVATKGWNNAKRENEIRNQIVSQRVKDLEITLQSIKRNGRVITITLMFKAVGEKYNTGYALKAVNSGGLADYWKFFPDPQASLSDDLGNNYPLNNVTGLGYARDRNDWTVLLIGETATAKVDFAANSNTTRNMFNFSLELWVLYKDMLGNPAKMPYTVTFRGIELK